MGRIIWTMVILAVGCYSLGVFIGLQVHKFDQRFDNADIQHVSYTPEQMGYDK